MKAIQKTHLFLVSLVLLLACSCVGDNVVSNSVIQKRKYTNGYHIWGQGKKQKSVQSSITVTYFIDTASTIITVSDSVKVQDTPATSYLKHPHTVKAKKEFLIREKQVIPLDSIDSDLSYERTRIKKQLLTTGLISILIGALVALTELIVLSPFIIILGLILILASVFITPKKDKAPLKERNPALHGCLSIVMAILILILAISLIALLVFGF